MRGHALNERREENRVHRGTMKQSSKIVNIIRAGQEPNRIRPSGKRGNQTWTRGANKKKIGVGGRRPKRFGKKPVSWERGKTRGGSGSSPRTR